MCNFKPPQGGFFIGQKMKKLIAITTDFGDGFASVQLRAILNALGFAGEVIENHGVAPFSILEGGFQILTLSKFTPSNTVHVGVVDPGVGSERKGIIIKTNKFYFVGPNNGLLWPAANKNGVISVWQIRESKIGSEISNTFHGRDVFIKVAAYLAKGKRPESFGAIKVSKSVLEKNDFRSGQVLHIDPYGNIKIYWPRKINIGEKLLIQGGKRKYLIPIVKTFSDVPPKKQLALFGSSSTLELAINLGSAKTFFDASIGDQLNISSLGKKKKRSDYV